MTNGKEKAWNIPTCANCLTRENLLRAAGMPRASRRNRRWTAPCGSGTLNADQFLRRPNYAERSEKLGIAARLTAARKTLEAVESADYPKKLVGTLGAEPVEITPARADRDAQKN